MREKLLISLTDDADHVRWGIVDDSGALRDGVHEDPLADIAAHAEKRQIVVLVPGSDVLLARAPIPPGQRKQARKLLPYVMEEQLADDIDDLHFALAASDAAAGRAFAAVSRRRMHEWLQRLDAAGIRPAAMIPDVLAVPPPGDGWSLLRINGAALLRTGNCAGVAWDAENSGFLLERLLGDDATPKPAQIRVMDYAPESVGLPAAAGVAIETIDRGDALQGLARLFESGAAAPALDLLQGDYSRKVSVARQWRPWLPALVLLAAWGLGETGLRVYTARQVAQENAALQAEIAAVYREVFPDARNIPLGRERIRVERRLAELNGDQANGGFLEMLTQVGSVINGRDGVTLKSVGFRDAVLQLGLEVRDLQLLDALKQELAGKTGYAVEIQGATSSAGHVQARLRIAAEAA